MSFLPVSLRLDNRAILVVGGGKAALEKVLLLRQFTSMVTVVAEEISDELRQNSNSCLERAFRTEDLDGVSLVYACKSEREQNRLLKQLANERGILVNTPDDPELCDFLSPACFCEGSMTVAVSSGGTDVRKAIAWRNSIKTYLSSKDGTVS